jgi:hypothetical protein
MSRNKTGSTESIRNHLWLSMCMAGVALALSATACAPGAISDDTETTDPDDGDDGVDPVDPSVAEDPGPQQVADVFDTVVQSPAITDSDPDVPAWVETLHHADASYIAPHFATAALPEGARLVVRSEDGHRTWTYTAEDVAARLAVSDGFWGLHIWGESAVVELYTPAPMPAGAVSIDRFAGGYDWLTLETLEPAGRAFCGADDSLNAVCYASSEPAAYDRARAVARLIIGGSSACTGWLLGSAGHVVTNNHCIGSSSAAANTSFDFMAEGSSCSSNCKSGGACSGTIVATTSTLIKTSGAQDYALVKLPGNPTGTYGYLQLRSSGATVGERIYIPEHSAAWGKRIAMNQGGSNVTVSSTTGSGGSTCGSNQVTYSADTLGGSSGSPVIAYGDHRVVALHHCGTTSGCTGLAVRIQNVIDHMGTSLPPNAISGGGGGETCGNGTCAASESCASCPADCGDCPGGECAHDPCDTGARLDASCDSCVADICAVDAYCCNNSWDSICVGEVSSVCGETCGGGGGGEEPPECVHTPCAAGSKLDADCHWCVTDICEVDPYCCNVYWDSICVGEIESVCDATCG